MADIPKIANLLERDITEIKRYLTALSNIINHSRAIDAGLNEIWIDIEERQKKVGFKDDLFHSLKKKIVAARTAERRALEKVFKAVNLKLFRKVTDESLHEIDIAYKETNDVKNYIKSVLR